MHELRTQVLLAQRLGLIEVEVSRQVLELLARLGAKLQAYIRGMELSTVREVEVSYE